MSETFSEAVRPGSKPPQQTRVAHRSPAEVAATLSEVERMRAAGETVAQACRKALVPVPTYYRWRASANPAPKISNSPDEFRKAIMSAAKAVFLREGYRVSLARIAAAAGVARQTLYNQFGGKEALFSAIVQQAYERSLSRVLVIDKGDDFIETLKTYGRHFLANALDSEGLAFLRITLGEFRTFPDLARVTYALRASHSEPVITDHIAKYLREKMADGTIDHADPTMVAEAFCGSFTQHPRHRALIGSGGDTPATQEAALALSVQIFARGLGYRPECDHGRSGSVPHSG